MRAITRRVRRHVRLHSPKGFCQNCSLIFQHSIVVYRSAVEALCMSHVCRSWRATALDTSSLWSSISMRDTQDAASSPNLRRFSSFLRLQLKRSRTYPIDVEVLLCFDKAPVGNDNALDIRGPSSGSRHRWRKASISVSTSVNLNYRVCPKEMLYWKN